MGVDIPMVPKPKKKQKPLDSR